MSPDAPALVVVDGLKKHFPARGGLFRRAAAPIKAVDGVSLRVSKGETFGLVGESGCGKSTLARCLLRLEEPTGGTLVFDGHDLMAQSTQAMRALRRDMQIIFQDPFSSLNPRKTVGATIGEAFR